MGAIKTAISVEEFLFQEMEHIAKERHLSRSEVFARAAEEFVERQKNLKTLNKLNKIYAVGQTQEERKQCKKAMKKMFRVIDPW